MALERGQIPSQGRLTAASTGCLRRARAPRRGGTRGPQPAAQSRNGSSRKTVTTDSGKVALDIPRDRNGTFDPLLIAKYQRRFPEFDRKIVSMYARGMTTREIQGHIEEIYIEEIYDVEASPNLISAITDAVMDEVTGCGLSARGNRGEAARAPVPSRCCRGSKVPPLR